MIITLWFLGLLALICIVVVLYNKDTSLLVIASLIGLCSVGTLVSWLVSLPYLLIIWAIPLGFTISWFSRDELLLGRRWFYAAFIVSLVMSIIFFVKKNSIISYSLLFVALISVVSVYQSYDTRWTKRVKSKV
jgi:hypothetical protein